MADLQAIKARALDSIEAVLSIEELESLRVYYLGKKGELTALLKGLGSLPVEQRPKAGEDINLAKREIAEFLHEKRLVLKQKELEQKLSQETIDVTLPGRNIDIGGLHPISLTLNSIKSLFFDLGYTEETGPEIEDDWHNFTALNTPEEHPARDMQDTFFIQSNPSLLLRSHTSSVQVRHLEKNSPPIRILSPGRVYRNEAISARAHCLFHQIEGLYIDNNVSFSDLKQTLLYFAKNLFGEKSKIRLRPSYFPFTEPSAEVDVYWGLKNEADYRITKGTGWLEILGCGMVDPNVLSNCGINPNKYSGFAFGMGIERIAMLKYKIDDIRLFYENDVRFLKQFSASL